MPLRHLPVNFHYQWFIVLFKNWRGRGGLKGNLNRLLRTLNRDHASSLRPCRPRTAPAAVGDVELDELSVQVIVPTRCGSAKTPRLASVSEGDCYCFCLFLSCPLWYWPLSAFLSSLFLPLSRSWMNQPVLVGLSLL